ncbi:hypothetical protein [Hyphomonas sp.]|uniref:hypothetical protein n=1 Tax=Hyphomonas sp. TaxID=87 RepID=UPI0032420E0E
MAPKPANEHELEKLKAGIAAAGGFELYGQYGEADAAGFLKIHPQTLKRIRLEGRIEYVRIGPRNIFYLGVNIVDFLIGSMEWQTDPTPSTNSENTGSARAKAPPTSTGSGGTPAPDGSDALRLARQTLQKRKDD